MDKNIANNTASRPPHAKALLPFAVFLLFYFGISLATGDFYRIPMPVAFLAAAATAMCQDLRKPLRSKVNLFAKGMGDPDIMAMCMIFILAGGFAGAAKAMGAVEVTVQLAMACIPSQWLLLGLFVVSCFISLSIGTSVGTVSALTPIAVELTQSLGLTPGLPLGIVIGGAMFGDNLSMISDTTIAATRTQKVDMRSKFYANFFLATGAAVITLAVYWVLAPKIATAIPGEYPLSSFFLVLPYIAVLVLALLGINVMAVLLIGIFLAGIIGVGLGKILFLDFLAAAGAGINNMAETLIVALLAGGLLKVIRYNGGISFLIQLIERGIHGRRMCELGIAGLVAVVNIFTANNTVAIVVAGPIARDLAEKYKVPAKRSASILDTTSCVIQGLLPYGAQILVAVGLAGNQITPFGIIRYLYYPLILAIVLLISIAFAKKKA